MFYMDLQALSEQLADDSALVARLRGIREAKARLELERFGLAALWVERHPYALAADPEDWGDVEAAPTIMTARARALQAAERAFAEAVAGDGEEGDEDGGLSPGESGSTGAGVAEQPEASVPDPHRPRGLWRVEEFSIAKVAAALAMGTDATERLLLHADQLRTHLPKVFALVMARKMTLWRAREVAGATLWLTPEACAFVDDQLDWAPKNYGSRQLDGLIKQALVRYMPEQLASLQDALADPGTRHVQITHAGQLNGDAEVDARLNAADGRILDDVLTHLASRMREQGVNLPVDELRALALGDLARAAYGELPLPPIPPSAGPVAPTASAGPVGPTGPTGPTGQPLPPGEMAPPSPSTPSPSTPMPPAPMPPPHREAEPAAAGEKRTDGRGVPRGQILMYLHLDASDLWPSGLPSEHPEQSETTDDSSFPPFSREHLSRVPVQMEGRGIPQGTVVSADLLAPMFFRPSSLSDLADLGRTHRFDPVEPDRSDALGSDETALEPEARHGTGLEGTGMPTPAGTGVPAPAGRGVPAPHREPDRHSPRFEGPQIIVRPVIDLDEPRSVNSYTPSERMREQLLLSDEHCSFPSCTRSARAADLDHIHPWRADCSGRPEGGATCTCQLAPLCRYHHRVKTHARADTSPWTGDDAARATGAADDTRTVDAPAGFTGAGADLTATRLQATDAGAADAGAAAGLHPEWDYVKLGAGTYLWHGPHGLRLLRTPHGTVELETIRLATAAAQPNGQSAGRPGGTADVEPAAAGSAATATTRNGAGIAAAAPTGADATAAAPSGAAAAHATPTGAAIAAATGGPVRPHTPGAPTRILPAEWEAALGAEWAKGTLAQELIARSDDTTISDRAEERRRAYGAARVAAAAYFSDEPPF